MTRLITKATLAAAFAALGFAQGPQSQPFRGVLMDANCPAIQQGGNAESAAAAGTAEVTRSRTSNAQAPPANQTQSSGVTNSTTVANSTSVGGPAVSTSSGAGASGSLSTTTNSGGTAGTRNTAAGTTGANNSHEGQATAHAATIPPTEARSTAVASGPGASGASSVTNYSGNTGKAAAANSNVTPGAVPNQGTGSSAQGSATTGAADATVGAGDRNRTDDTMGAGAAWATVRDKYTTCRVTPGTSTFALMSEGQLYRIDDTSGAVRQRMASMPASSDWRSVTLMGTLQGDHINVTSVQ